MTDSTPEVRVREARETDAAEIVRIFESAYGRDYMHPEFYEDKRIRGMILSDGALMLVAEDSESGRILGTASVVLEAGAFSDLVGEFGRLVVHPDARERGIGSRLMEGRLARVRDRLHVGLVEARTAHPFSCRIAERHGFAAVGLLADGLWFGHGHEHAMIYMQHFGEALALRRNHPRIIPEAHELAGLAMSNVGIDLDVIVDEQASPYPHGGVFDIEEMGDSGYSSLLRIERGRVRKREIFGPLKLHYGFFRLEATQARYLIARDGGRIVGAVGFILDTHERHIRIFELIHLDESAVRGLLADLDRRAGADWDVGTIEIDVAADAPAMQRTLLELGYRPACYLPAFSFHQVERLDVVKMWRQLRPAAPDPGSLPEDARAIAAAVLGSFRQQRMLPRIREVMGHMKLFAGLSEEQGARLGGLIDGDRFARGDRLFERGGRSDDMYLLIEGRISIEIDGAEVGSVQAGECVGEVALLAGRAHSASAVAATDIEVGVLGREALERVVRERPDIGVTLYRNLAGELGEKLLRADAREPEG